MFPSVKKYFRFQQLCFNLPQFASVMDPGQCHRRRILKNSDLNLSFVNISETRWKFIKLSWAERILIILRTETKVVPETSGYFNLGARMSDQENFIEILKFCHYKNFKNRRKFIFGLLIAVSQILLQRLPLTWWGEKFKDPFAKQESGLGIILLYVCSRLRYASKTFTKLNMSPNNLSFLEVSYWFH